MADRQNAPPKEVGAGAPNHQDDRPTTPAKRISGLETTDTSHFIAATSDTADNVCRCAIGTPCTCDFYADWTVHWPTTHTEHVSVQLQRRRLASYRCPRLESGRRDPISQSVQ